ncbi:hypothetical protein KUV46_10185 [Thalassovita mediterranea]|nr:hypothetical protein KUV46_10185 [Thalassovita mediterranea]
MSVKMEDGRIFILGAGFSASAGIHMTNTLLPEALNLMRRDIPGIYERISEYAKAAGIKSLNASSAADFARLCTLLDFIELREHGGNERYSEHGSRERVPLKRCLAQAIALSTPEIADTPQLYLNFAANLDSNDIVLTFNWDCLLENALEQIGKPFSYLFEENAIPIIKLHGSINWHRTQPEEKPPASTKIDNNKIGFVAEGSEYEFYASNNLRKRVTWEQNLFNSPAVRPFLVLPGFGKAYDVRSLATLWYRLEFINLRRGGVSIIGLNVSEDDFLVEGMFRYLLQQVFPSDREIRILNPAQHVKTKFENLAGGEVKIDFNQSRFEDRTLNYALLV